MPTRLVFDASVLVKYLLHEEGWEDVKVFFDQAVEGSLELYSIDLALKEIGSVIQKYSSLGRGKGIAPRIYHQLLSQKIISYHRQDTSILKEAFELGLQNELSMYDAVYIVLARSLGAELVTSDRRQAAVARTITKVREVR
ncbi:MAG: type II toxin-antitoxin system VapC family toxin [Thaumarchaeota archaeon]|nr:type II toxin-antitoxin system VapC family toxin [Nitrososphaerota archaeon]